MNFEITPRQFDGNAVQTINARDLHSFIDSRQDFSTWIKSRIEQYGFEENADYLIHKFMEQLPSGAKQKIDYHVTIDMAKELAMVERNDKGHAARRYFIECERKLKAPKQNQIQPIEQAKPTAEAVGVICDILRLPDSGKIGMLKSAMAPWPIICNAIPNYSHDAPVASNAGEANGSTQSNSAVSTLPISKIVEGWLTARTANAALEKAGLIKTVERVKRGGSIATFKTVTEEGLKYGKNVVDFRNTRETNPHWFASKTEELKEIIKQNL